MRKILFLVLVGSLTFALESCSTSSKSDDKSVEDKSVNTIVVDAAGKDRKQANKKPNSTTEEAKAPQKEEFEEAKREENVVGLIPATQPEIRVRGSIRGRQDPFAIVPIRPEIEIIEGEVIAPPPVKNTNNSDRVPTIEPQPEIPVAELAKDVLITGMIEFGDRIKLIIQAPEETSTRYVEIGQYLSNGQILVKRIEPGFPAPTVILEQDGVEVPKVVGESQEEETITFSPVDREPITNATLKK